MQYIEKQMLKTQTYLMLTTVLGSDHIFITSLSCLGQEYKSLTMKPDCPAEVWVYLGCALFFLGLYKEAEETASKGRSLC